MKLSSVFPSLFYLTLSLSLSLSLTALYVTGLLHGLYGLVYYILIFCSIFIPIICFLDISLASWCEVCGGSSSLRSTELTALYVTGLLHGLYGLVYYILIFCSIFIPIICFLDISLFLPLSLSLSLCFTSLSFSTPISLSFSLYTRIPLHLSFHLCFTSLSLSLSYSSSIHSTHNKLKYHYYYTSHKNNCHVKHSRA